MLMLSEPSPWRASSHRFDINYIGFPTQCPITVAIDLIELSLKQPRRYFDPKKLAQLVESVKEHGILEPVLVRPLPLCVILLNIRKVVKSLKNQAFVFNNLITI